ncbi:MAG: asparagine synthase (glutamine-hydrolyzing), partial [Planctomycetaceae bacterium]|nr:asparagine synthase (glutamine-hydrolyzing) [Planctomycetaceae bacterium]
MCGFAGFLGADENAVIEAMVRVLHHRGPDDCDTFSDPRQRVRLGHTRLSILDLSSLGRQPMTDEASQITMVYNGELYNFRALRAELAQLGHTFESQCDSEVVLRAFVAWGSAAFRRFNGLFAAAFWNGETGEVTLVRDRFGIKPLYYFRAGKVFVFGSEIKALLEHPVVEPRLEAAALHEFLYYGNNLRRRTLFEGVSKLLPGHYLTVDATGAVCESPYWQVEDVAPVACSEQEARERVRELLERAVASQLVSDVPVGVFLSGGIDSSAITAFASRHYGRPIKTYSVAFDFAGAHNELAQAKNVAQQFGTEHHEMTISGYDVARTIEELIGAHDLPFSDAANIPLFLLAGEIPDDVKVILQGDGGDEMFAGYRRHNTVDNIGLMRLVARFANGANRLFPRNAKRFWRQRYIDALLSSSDAGLMALLLTMETRNPSPLRVLNEDVRAEVAEADPFAAYTECDRRFASMNLTQKLLYTDTQLILADIFLEKVDRSAMAQSVEVRVPFL